MPYWSLLVLSIPLCPCFKELFLSFLFKLASPVPFIGLCPSIVPLRGCSISIHFIIIKYENEHEHELVWCWWWWLWWLWVVCLSAYLPALEIPDYLWTCGKICGKVCGKVCGKIGLRTPTYMLCWMGRPCAKSGYLDGPAMCKTKRRWAKEVGRRRGDATTTTINTIPAHVHVHFHIWLW